MASRANSKRGRFITILISVVVLAVILGLVADRILLDLSIFKLHANTYGFISIIATAIDISVVFLVLKFGKKTDDNGWFLLFIIALAVYGVCEALQRFSLLPAGASFWEHLSGLGFALSPAAFYLFIASYTAKIRTLPRLLMPGLITAAAVIGFFDAVPGIIIPSSNSTLYAWGYYSVYNQTGYLLVLGWIFVLMVASLVTLYRHYRNISEDIVKHQARFLLAVTALWMLIAFTTDGILPAIGYYGLPPLAMLLFSLMAICIYAGRSSFHLFEINSTLLSENILSTMNEAVVVTDTQMRIQRVNEMATRLLAGSAEDLNHERFQKFFAMDSWQKIKGFLGGDKHSYEIGDLELVNIARQKIPVQVYNSSLAEDGAVFAYIFVISDITEITKSYRDLQRLEVQLAEEKAGVERTVQERTKELVAAQEKLKKTDAYKNEFIMLTSHNLRTPISIVSGNTDLLKHTKLSKEQTEYVQNLEQSVQRLSQYTEDLLVIGSIEAGDTSDLKSVTLHEVLDPLVQQTQSLAKAKKLKFTTTIEPPETLELRANPRRLQSALWNLLDNAIKFTAKGSVELAVTKQDKQVAITVSDTGIGIAPEEIPQLFTRFHRGTSILEYNYEGEGIGLALAKLVITEHGGTISVISKLDSGTTFTVTLPLL